MIRRVLVVVVGICLLVAIFYFAVLPRLNLAAVAKPTAPEKWLGRYAVRQWVERNASNEPNPLAPTVENLKLAEAEFKEHCAGCHGLDGEGHSELGADFYPPVLPLIGETQDGSDGQLYFVIANGIRFSAMPGFGAHHDREDIWRTVLWVRHLAHLSPEEKQAIAAAMEERREKHKAVMHEGEGRGHHH